MTNHIEIKYSMTKHNRLMKAAFTQTPKFLFIFPIIYMLSLTLPIQLKQILKMLLQNSETNKKINKNPQISIRKKKGRHSWALHENTTTALK